MTSKNLALITGASSGIGAALSRELVQRGWSVIGMARSQDKLAALQKELGYSFTPVICDISQKSEIERASREILEKEKCPTHFFLNAGIAGEKVIENPQAFDLSVSTLGFLKTSGYLFDPLKYRDKQLFARLLGF